MSGDSTHLFSRVGAMVAAWIVAVALLVLPTLAAPASAADPCGVGGNKVACENTLPGSLRLGHRRCR